jgi:type I restriction enzyme S subunit
MNAIQQLLTDHLDIWTAADTAKKSGRGRSSGNAASVYGIRKLRELILELAVRGKLVPQDTNDEPASELLKRIQAEKAKLIAEGKIKKEKPLVPITEDEKPFDLPSSWEWVRIGRIGHDWGQKTPSADFTYIEVSAIDSQRGIISSPELVKPENAPSRARKVVKKGTVIYSTIRPYLLNIAVIEEDFLPEPIASTAFAIVHPFCSMPPRYFLCFFRSPVFVRYVESVQMGIAYPAINDGQFFSGLISLPPIEEQHRIVAKVDELMVLCDQLETQHNNAAVAHEQLVSQLLATLTLSQNAADFSANWQRIAAHFDTLFTTEASIDALKQTLLQLAVMGKLVPQDPNDEPASELLKRIQAEKAGLVTDGKIKKDKPLAPISDEEKSFELPQGWEWVRLKDIVYVLGDGLHGTPTYTPNSECYFVNGNNLDKGQITIKPETKTVSLDEMKKHRKSLNERTVLVSINGTIGNVAFYNNENIILGKSACYFNLANLIYKHFVKVLIESPYFMEYALNSVSGTTIMNLSLFSMNNFPLSIPPLAEQHRIVAKVNELMTLCDHLKSRITATSQLQQKLADVMVEQAISH